ncbi:Response regulator receiver domain-containing protein [Selenomonas ruminantium]|uniref:Response regulator receiver domain-containing protein n=1 Tax=Selenomonas ruminantium TaxID=971 RepID=A0A1M6VFL7_SELRU|nr:response regulator [Selenomonas ruminantium]SHK80181.1 Response regulator receiver domain-containing protein [Selenomonas ruminantium]
MSDSTIRKMKGCNRNIVIVMYQYSVIVKSIERKLLDLRYSVDLLMGDFAKVSEKVMARPLFLVYLPKNIAADEENMASLRRIIEMVAKKDGEMVLLGENSDYADVMMQVPQAGEYEWLNRPLKMDELELVVKRHTNSHSKRILIVDDDPVYAKMVREWLKDEYSTFVVTEGTQVIKFLRQNPVDLILLDYEMPVMDGPQVFRMLKQNENFKNTSVVFLTGVAGKENVERVMELKPRGYFLKSNTREQLLDYIERKI